MNSSFRTKAHKLKILFPLALVLTTSGCVDLSGSRSTYSKKHVQNTIAQLGEVHTMLGGLGLFSKGMNTVRDSVISQYKVPAYGTIWYNAGHVSRFIINNYYQQKHPRPIVLVGHSLGANDQIKVARNLNAAGVPVALLVTVDAVSQTIVPPNVKEALNIYKPGFVPMFSGLKLRAVDPSKTHIDNVNVNDIKGVDVNHFTIDKDTVVQEMILKRINKVLAHGKKREQNLSPRVCIIGGGPSGITAAKNLQEQGLTNITVFEQNSKIGGNWVYSEDNTHSSVYETTHIISSKRWSQFEDFPMPEEYPDYPSHTQLLHYFNSYVAHFNLVRYVKFNTTVIKVTQIAQQKWLVAFQDEQGMHQEEYDYLLVANGHHWDPFLPTYPGDFVGESMHSHQYKKAMPFKGKRVLVVGGGNSACDIAVETSRISSSTTISMRRGCHIFPKFIFGKPTDVAVAKIQWIPAWLRQKLIKVVIRGLQGRYAKYQLMNPDCGPLELHPTINSELLYYIRHGKIKTAPGIERLEGNTVHFVNGSYAEYDTLVYATGYKISFPFFEGEERLNFANATKVPLYRKMMHPDFETLYFIGLCQPQGCIWPLADYQSKIVARIINGTLKRPERLQEKIDKEMNSPHYKFKSHRRHAVEVDYHLFRRELLQMLN